MPEKDETENYTAPTLLDALNALDRTLQEITALCHLLLAQLPAQERSAPHMPSSTAQLPGDSCAIILQIICDMVQRVHEVAERK